MRREDAYSESEAVIGLATAVGTPIDTLLNILQTSLDQHRQRYCPVRVSAHVLEAMKLDTPIDRSSEYSRIDSLMRAGNEAREKHGNNIVAYGIASHIAFLREREKATVFPRRVFVVRSLKHPDEVSKLRDVYGPAFFLLAVHASEKLRFAQLTSVQGLQEAEANELLARDADEGLTHGQRTRDVFQMADFFLLAQDDVQAYSRDVGRLLGLLYGDHRITPTVDEHAMYIAFATASRSGDLSRQVGAAIVRDRDVVATGANEVPRSGGGHYWANDPDDQRDAVRGHDSNKVVKQEIIDSIVSQVNVAAALGRAVDDATAPTHRVVDAEERGKRILKQIDAVIASENGHPCCTTVAGDTPAPSLTEIVAQEVRLASQRSRLNDITEYGRAVHAEMQAILTCARHGQSTSRASLYSTTFPCHNCAKHIIASGIREVIYVEPYPKSRAPDLHDDAIELVDPGPHRQYDGRDETAKVAFRPFVGVGPRRFIDLFSMNLGSGYRLVRHESSSPKARPWQPSEAILRTPLLPDAYLQLEDEAVGIMQPLLRTEHADAGPADGAQEGQASVVEAEGITPAATESVDGADGLHVQQPKEGLGADGDETNDRSDDGS